jgi:hypothetical protein
VGIQNVTNTVTSGVTSAYSSAYNTVSGRKLLAEFVQQVVRHAHAQP